MAREGDDVTLESCVEGTPKPTVKWTLNNKDIVYDERVKVSPANNFIIDFYWTSFSSSAVNRLDIEGVWSIDLGVP